jgi:molybdopterin synthase catalytic subunit
VEPTPDLVELCDLPLDAGAAISAVSEGGAGAIAIFLGTTRAETNEAGRRLVALDYEAYQEMALQQMHALADDAKQRWPILRLVVLHRVGRVELGQPSVLIAVSTAHRAEAFEACRFLIDRIKAEATIWKKEVWEDGSASWVGDHIGKSRRD